MYLSLIFYSLFTFNLIKSSPALSNQNWKLVLDENFESPQLDRSIWDIEVSCDGGGNLEQQCYVDHPDVLLIEDGKLTIQPKSVEGNYQLKEGERCTSRFQNGCQKGLQLPVKSGRIHTKLNKGFKYGRFEMRAQLPIGNYLWPTFWLLPTTDKYGGWPTGGEIDIMEAKGNRPDKVEFTLHHGAPWPNNQYFTHPYNAPNLFNTFHTFGVDYTSESINFFIDDNFVYNVTIKDRDFSNPNLGVNYLKKGMPFIDQEWYLIINLAVAGNYFGSGWKYDPINDPKTWSQPFIIDYVKVYQ